MLLCTDSSRVELVYYGEKLPPRRGESGDEYALLYRASRGRRFGSTEDLYNESTIFSFAGEGNDREEMLRLVNADGSLTNRFVFRSAEILPEKPLPAEMPASHGGGKTLLLKWSDEKNGLTLLQYLTPFPDSDAFTARVSLENSGTAPVRVRRLFSLQLDFDGRRAEIATLEGGTGRERNVLRNVLDGGVWSAGASAGMSSAKHNPFLLLALADGRRIACNLVWSGNHRELVEVNPQGKIRLLAGLGDAFLDAEIRPGEKFETPESVFACSGEEEETCARMRKFVARHIVRGSFAQAERPVVINSWEAVYFDFNRKKLLEIAELAAAAGVELFVLDDGWFGNRKDDRRALGDWTDNREKTGGLADFAAEIRRRGLKFGLWIEPEMISRDSELFRKHPEYAMRVPGEEPLEKRYQLMLDLANPEVSAFVADTVCNLLREIRPDYVKWDCNRNITDPYSAAFREQGDFFRRHTLALYGILNRVTREFPDILFESCAAGGNRFDLGMLCYMPQTWASDVTDCRERLKIQEGTLFAYPQSAMTAHVSESPNQQTGNPASVESRFNVAAAGVLGYELDLTRVPEEELPVIRAQIAFYKVHRRLLQFGEYRRLESGWIVLSGDRSEAIVTLIAEDARARFPLRMRFAGLRENWTYLVESRPQCDAEPLHFEASGGTLNRGMLDFGDLFGAADRSRTPGLVSRMFVVRRLV